jgi:hypothetical protein
VVRGRRWAWGQFHGYRNLGRGGAVTIMLPSVGWWFGWALAAGLATTDCLGQRPGSRYNSGPRPATTQHYRRRWFVGRYGGTGVARVPALRSVAWQPVALVTVTV